MERGGGEGQGVNEFGPEAILDGDVGDDINKGTPGIAVGGPGVAPEYPRRGESFVLPMEFWFPVYQGE